jgi:hypothetical protein
MKKQKGVSPTGTSPWARGREIDEQAILLWIEDHRLSGNDHWSTALPPISMSLVDLSLTEKSTAMIVASLPIRKSA